jgi:hypothetical protein
LDLVEQDKMRLGWIDTVFDLEIVDDILSSIELLGDQIIFEITIHTRNSKLIVFTYALEEHGLATLPRTDEEDETLRWVEDGLGELMI